MPLCHILSMKWRKQTYRATYSTVSGAWPKVMALGLGREWTRDLMRLPMSKFLPADRIQGIMQGTFKRSAPA